MTCIHSYARDCSECDSPRCPYIDRMGEEADYDVDE